MNCSGQKKWFLLQFKPNSHLLAERNLKRQGFEIFLPLNEVTKRRSSKFLTSMKPLFPGYMFASINPMETSWSKINSTVGVSRIVGFNGQPASVPLELVSGLMLRCDHNGKFLPHEVFKKGDKVKLLNGPFADFLAKIEDIDPRKRAWILIDFMGKETKVQVKTHLLEKF